MWWNIQQGTLAKKLQKKDDYLIKRNFLTENITTLIESSLKPEILIFGEYSPGAIDQETLNELADHYPYSMFSKYNLRLTGRNAYGILIFSTIRFTEARRAVLDWIPPGMSRRRAIDYFRMYWRERSGDATTKYERTYQNLRFESQRGGPGFHIVPVHLVQPWSGFARMYGEVETIYSVLYSDDNPLVNQVYYLRQNLKKDFGKRFNGHPLLVIGDFNVPKMKLVNVRGYEYASEGFSEVFGKNCPVTFPAVSSQFIDKFPYKYKRLKLDHAFINDHVSVKAAEVLNLKGSDHYPVYLVLNI